MKLYQVSTKYGRSPYQLAAYVDADSPKEAMGRYCGGEEQYNKNIADGFKYRATIIDNLPDNYWKIADYMRPKYIQE